MKQIITTISAVLLVGCGPSVDIHEAARTGNIEAVKQHIAAGADVNAKDDDGETPLDWAITSIRMAGNRNRRNILSPKGHSETADILRKHGGKTSEELKAEGK